MMEADKNNTTAQKTTKVTPTVTEDLNPTNTTATIPEAPNLESNASIVIDVDAITESTATTNISAKREPINKASAKPLIIVETIDISDGEDSPPPKPVVSADGAKKRKGTDLSIKEEQYKLKRRKIKAAGAPKMPLTGYVRYMNDRRETLKKELPTKTAMELTKVIAEEWSQLSDDRKNPYIKAAEADKQRYFSELRVFLKTHPDILASEKPKNKSAKSGAVEESSTATKTAHRDKLPTNANIEEIKDDKKHTKDDLAITASARKARAGMHVRRLSVNYAHPTYNLKEKSPPAVVEPPPVTDEPLPLPIPTRKRTPTPPYQQINKNLLTALATPLPGEIPIFTNDFLEHNKTFDMELRTLRKSKADLEQQNAVLEKHVENMKFGVEKMVSENDELQEKNRLLKIYLEKLKRKLANALSGLAIPSEPQGATLENIDKYMNDLYKMATSNTHGPASLNKAKDIIRKLDLQIQL